MPTQIQGIEFEVVGSGADAAAKSLDKLADSLKGQESHIFGIRHFWRK